MYDFLFVIFSNVLSGLLSTGAQVFTIDNRTNLCSFAILQGFFINTVSSFLFYANLRSIERYNFGMQVILATFGTIIGWLGFSRIAQKQNTIRLRQQFMGLACALLNVGLIELQKRFELG